MGEQAAATAVAAAVAQATSSDRVRRVRLSAGGCARRGMHISVGGLFIVIVLHVTVA